MADKVVITGGASGIGYAVAEKLLAEGGSVCLLDMNGDTLAAARDKLGGERITTGVVDVRNEAALDTQIRNGAEAMGGLTGCVASAGIGHRKTILDGDAEDFARIIAINLTGVYATLRAAAKVMIEQGTGGALVSLASATGVRGCAERAAYGASKAGVINLTEVAALEFAKHGIRVNALCPAPINTPLIAGVQDANVRAEWMQGIPMNRYGEPAEVAELAAFLLSDKASYITGQAVNIDGGWSAAGVQTAATRIAKGAGR
ncbi:MAG: SDR family oxidoreductase [Nisaea sp.]|uniref:SDR family NAD(P)-dependent oxidoreductase n=1 Tax=Nisaea sp. TaxID=2024842 RepID=UPI001B1D18AC|nr:SDR family NAD(P)-dependent oxidoreductase [Nisaea sp.]MBO6560456.1 SDR family oxidoreductase [Nisaea sp.]